MGDLLELLYGKYKWTWIKLIRMSREEARRLEENRKENFNHGI